MSECSKDKNQIRTIVAGWKLLHPITNINHCTVESIKKSHITTAFTYVFTVLLLHDVAEECVNGFHRFMDKVIDVLQNFQN